jgi:glycosyltransferase involved in cell wall biosynthesis
MARSNRIVASQTLDAVAWTRFQPRTSALANALGGQVRFINDGFTGSRFALRPLAYLVKSVQTWQVLSRDDPQTVLVITPPVFAPFVAWLWCVAHKRVLVVDCHTGAFHSSKWAWARPLHRWLLRRVRVVLLHTEELEALVSTWGARAMLFPDDLPSAGDASPQAGSRGTSVLIAGSFDSNEPVEIVIEAARLLPDVEFRFTGDPGLLPAKVRGGAPANVVLTGYLAYPVFLGELQAADVVGVFSTDPRIMNRAAFEAVGLGCALVLSDLPGLRDRFGSAALFSENDPAAIAAALAGAISTRSELARKSVALQAQLRAQRDRAVVRLRSIIDGEGGSGWRHLNAS